MFVLGWIREQERNVLVILNLVSFDFTKKPRNELIANLTISEYILIHFIDFIKIVPRIFEWHASRFPFP